MQQELRGYKKEIVEDDSAKKQAMDEVEKILSRTKDLDVD